MSRSGDDKASSLVGWARLRAAPLSVGGALILAFAAYHRVLRGPFLFDDAWVVAQNLSIKSLDGLVASLRTGSLADRPVTAVTFALNYAAGRLDPWGYHLVNVVIHLAAAALLYLLARALLRRARAPAAELVAAGAAGSFALHPLNSQAVSYVVQRSESLAALLTVAILLLLLAAEQTESRARRVGWVALASIAYVIALGTKLPAIVAPILWLAATIAFPANAGDAAPSRRRRIAAIGAPLLLAGGLLAIATLVRLRGHADVGFDVPGIEPWAYLLTQAHAVLLYARLLFWPAGQSIDHDLPLVTGLDGATAAAGAVLLAVLIIGGWLLAKPPRGWSPESRASARVAGFGVVWWFVALAPSSSIIPVRDLAVEHRAYLATFGLLLAAAVAIERTLARLSAPHRPPVATMAFAVAWLVLGTALHRRNAVWTSELALWSDAASKAPARVRPLVNAAFARQSSGDLDGAIAGYRQALSLPADPVHTPARIRFYLGSALVQQHRPAEAYDVLRTALESEPWNPDLLNGLAIAALDLARPAEAERLASAAFAGDPSSGKALNTLGEALLAQRRPEAALEAFSRAASLNPDSPRRQFNVALTASRLGRHEEGCIAVARYGRTPGEPALDAQIATIAAELACRTTRGTR